MGGQKRSEKLGIQNHTRLTVNFGIKFKGKLSFQNQSIWQTKLDCVKRIWYLLSMRAAKVQASLRIHAVSPEPPLLAHTSSESRGTFRQKASSLALLNGWACAVKICNEGMLEDTNSLDGAQLMKTGIILKTTLKKTLVITQKASSHVT